MATLVGEVFVALRPETTGFGEAVKSKINTVMNPGGSGGLAGVMNKIGAASAAALVAGVGASLKLASDMQTAQAQLQGTMGITARQANAIGDALLNTAGKATFSGLEQMRALAPVSGVLKMLDGQALGAEASVRFMESTMQLADATNHDLAGSTQAVVKVLQAFQLKSRDAAMAANTLFTTSRSTGVSVGTLSGVLAQLHMRMGDLDPSLKGVSALMVDLAQHGTTGSRGIRAVSSAVEHLIQQTTKAGPALQKSIDSSSKAYQTAQDAVTKAQTRLSQEQARIAAAGGAPTLAQQQALASAQDALTKAQSKSADAAQKLASAQAGANLTSSSAQATLTNLGISLFNANGKFIGMKALITELQPKLAGLTGGARQLALANLFGAGAAQQMDQVVKAGPAAFQRAYDAVNKQNAVQQAAAAYMSTTRGQIEILKASASDMATKFGRVLLPAVNIVVHGLAVLAGFFAHNKVAAEALAITLGVILGGAMLHWVKNIATSWLSAAKKDISAILDLGRAMKVSAAETVAADEAEAGANEAAAGSFSLLGAAMDALPILALIAGIVLIATHWHETVTVLKVGAELVGHAFVWLWDKIKAGAAAAFNWVKHNWPLLVGILGGPIGVATWAIIHWRKQVVDAIMAVIRWFGSLGSKIADVFKDAGKWLLNAGKQVIMGLVHGIENGAKWLWNGLRGIGGGIVHFFTGLFGIGSPSRLFHGYGQNLMEGLANGIRANVHLPQGALGGLELGSPGLGSIGALPGSAASAATARQTLGVLQQLVHETRQNTSAVQAATDQQKKPIKATVASPGVSSPNSNAALALSLAR